MSKPIIIISLCALFFTMGCKQESSDLNEDLQKPDIKSIKLLSKVRAVMKTVYGNIEFKFYPKEAPNTCIRIAQLIEKGFYDGLPFHRVISNFVIQTGDPTNTGHGGSGYKLRPEFNSIQHVRGTIAMARAESDPGSADSQFYIALSTLAQLDGKYTVFAQVTSGEELLEKIKQGDKIISLVIEQDGN